MTSADTITYHLISQLLNKNVKLFSFHTQIFQGFLHFNWVLLYFRLLARQNVILNLGEFMIDIFCSALWYLKDWKVCTNSNQQIM